MQKKALIVAGCTMPNGSIIHDPFELADLFAAELRQEGVDVTVSRTLGSYADEQLMKGLDLIVPDWTVATFTKEQLSGLLTAVKRGVGIAAWHGGGARNNPEPFSGPYEFLFGASWIFHPPQSEFEVTIVKTDDPVVAGLSNFRMTSEQFYFHVDPKNEVLATLEFDGEHQSGNPLLQNPWIAGTVMPAVWKRRYGEGRVFYSSLGHAVKDFEIYECREIMRRGMLWAMR
jgi:type 1 glutamine amidotransferase